MRKEKGTVVYGFPATGKTTLCKKYKDCGFVDLESGEYEYILTEEQKKLSTEERKGIKKEKNPAYPKNYLKAIKQAVKEYKFVFVSHQGIIQCAKNGIDYWRIFPRFDAKQEYVQRLINRGNNPHFVNGIETNFERYIMVAIEDDSPHCKRKIVMEKGEYLEDVFKKLGLL